MYPLLNRMLDEGWLADGWEDHHGQMGRPKRPPRRYYEVTDVGKLALGALIADAHCDSRFASLMVPQAAGRLA